MAVRYKILVTEEFSKNLEFPYSFTERFRGAHFEAKIKGKYKGNLYRDAIEPHAYELYRFSRVAKPCKKHGLYRWLTLRSQVCKSEILSIWDCMSLSQCHKILGGHLWSFRAGAVAFSTTEHMERFFHLAKNFGGSFKVIIRFGLLETQLKPMGIRGKSSERKCLKNGWIYYIKIRMSRPFFYPGLPKSSDHESAKAQMKDTEAMLFLWIKWNHKTRIGFKKQSTIGKIILWSLAVWLLLFVGLVLFYCVCGVFICMDLGGGLRLLGVGVFFWWWRVWVWSWLFCCVFGWCAFWLVVFVWLFSLVVIGVGCGVLFCLKVPYYYATKTSHAFT